MFKDLLSKARKAAREHLPEEVVAAGKKLRDTVVEHAPEPLAEVIDEYVPPEDDEPENEAASEPASEPAPRQAHA